MECKIELRSDVQERIGVNTQQEILMKEQSLERSKAMFDTQGLVLKKPQNGFKLVPPSNEASLLWKDLFQLDQVCEFWKATLV